MRVRSVRLLRSMRWVNILPVRCLFFRHLPPIVAPVIAGQHADVEECKHASSSGTFDRFGDQSGASTPPVLVLYAYQSQCCRALLPTVAPLLIKLADKRHISMGNRRRRYSLLARVFKVRMTVLYQFSVSRRIVNPAPLKAISVISSFDPALRA